MDLESSNLGLTIGSRVDKETGKPKVVIQIYQYHEVIKRSLIMLELTPLEARASSHLLLENAEGAEQVAHAIIGMREQKIPEDVIQEVLISMEKKRNHF